MGRLGQQFIQRGLFSGLLAVQGYPGKVAERFPAENGYARHLRTLDMRRRVRLASVDEAIHGIWKATSNSGQISLIRKEKLGLQYSLHAERHADNST